MTEKTWTDTCKISVLFSCYKFCEAKENLVQTFSGQSRMITVEDVANDSK